MILPNQAPECTGYLKLGEKAGKPLMGLLRPSALAAEGGV
jgi:hypothetical protein